MAPVLLGWSSLLYTCTYTGWWTTLDFLWSSMSTSVVGTMAEDGAA